MIWRGARGVRGIHCSSAPPTPAPLDRHSLHGFQHEHGRPLRLHELIHSQEHRTRSPARTRRCVHREPARRVADRRRASS